MNQIVSEDEYMDGMETAYLDMGGAILAMQNGELVAREGWNGKGMFLWLKSATTVKEEWCHDPLLKAICHKNGGEVRATGTVCMYTAQHTVVSGWLASQTDLLATDWKVVTDEVGLDWEAGI